MIAYKFRSAEPLEYVLDILNNNRLHCADWHKLNDPVEGLFTYSYNSNNNIDPSYIINKIYDEKQNYKVCSLSRTWNNYLLWAHYASGFTGFAVEVELPENDDNIKKVTYRGVFAHISMDNYQNPNISARKILFSKYHKWKYEQEIRILHTSEKYDLPKSVKKIIVGHRIHKSALEDVKLICKQKEIELCMIGIGDDGLSANKII
jgi:hypothetical protein